MKSFMTIMVTLFFAMLFSGSAFGQQGERRDRDRDNKDIIIVDDDRKSDIDVERQDRTGKAKVDVNDDGVDMNIKNDKGNGVKVETDRDDNGSKETVTRKVETKTEDGKKVKKTKKVKRHRD